MEHCIILIILTIALPTFLEGFDVYWNFPSGKCQKNKTYHINLESYKIKENTDHKFEGDKIVIFYESKFGLYPYYKEYNASQPINGGLPQVYQNQSILYVRQRYPEIKDETIIERLAEAEFNSASMRFFVETIQKAKEMRPYAKWGFYGFPFCNYNAEHSIRVARFFQAVLMEARRISKMFKPPLPIYAYTKIEYDPTKEIRDDFYNNVDQHSECRKVKCSDLGKCVKFGNDTCNAVTPTKLEFHMKFDEYHCECDSGVTNGQCSSALVLPP
ncbi:unnamed protein product [Strongylus vulgaris]|uniref:Hyaluronidase n=1 Tax=Strongylus vulgaris TaxID=40348 RepID=A0A3P7L995_STRVU|nr:unnamed protein product [Strongylus vulgaris]